jgi:hypothetical protein
MKLNPPLIRSGVEVMEIDRDKKTIFIVVKMRQDQVDDGIKKAETMVAERVRETVLYLESEGFVKRDHPPSGKAWITRTAIKIIPPSDGNMVSA